MKRLRIAVLGAGVIGLSTAIRLQRDGHSVTILADKFPPETTSNVAAAIWYPYRADPLERVRGWSLHTLRVLNALAGVLHSGVRIVPGRKCFHRPMGLPWWRDAVADFRKLDVKELPPGAVAGYGFSVPIADTSIYLNQYLWGEFRERNGESINVKLRTLADVEVSQVDIVVNCTGLGSKELLADQELFPIRGDVLRVGTPYPDQFYLDTDHPRGICYVVPRAHDCILGGTAEKGETSLTWNPETENAIRTRVGDVFPVLRESSVLERRVGLRPGRRAVRLERDPEGLKGKPLLHNYGHGGAGVTLSWGTAEEIAALVHSV